MESNFFVLQVTTAILRESGSAVQRVYDEKFSNQDQLNIGEAVVTLSGNLLSDILIHVTGNMLLQHIFDVYFRWILSGLLLKFKISSYYLENYYIKFQFGKIHTFTFHYHCHQDRQKNLVNLSSV